MNDSIAGEPQKYVYLIFSKTTTRIGGVIRRVTRYPYNHVSLSLDADLAQVYSFARHYKDTPLYGGFVRETRLRYYDNRGTAKILVCAVPVSAEQYENAVLYIKNVSENTQKYLYNAISAAFVPIRVRIFIDSAYTCAEFAIEFLAHINAPGAPDRSRFCSIERLTNIYRNYAIYEGPFPEYDASSDDYCRKNAVLHRVRKTVSSNAKLFGRLCRRITRL